MNVLSNINGSIRFIIDELTKCPIYDNEKSNKWHPRIYQKEIRDFEPGNDLTLATERNKEVF